MDAYHHDADDYSGQLCISGQLVLRGTRIVLPQYLRAQALALVHEGHLGIVGNKQNLRSKVYWPGMNKAAEKHCNPPEQFKSAPLPDALAANLMRQFPLATLSWSW